jgi:hypothetical protein
MAKQCPLVLKEKKENQCNFTSKSTEEPGVVVHDCIISTQKTEAGAV